MSRMKPAVQWFRTPTWANPFDANPEQARNAAAVFYLLREWHLGADPTERQLRALTGFGAGRSIRLFWETLAWAKEAGAAFPERLIGVTGPKLDLKRTTNGPATDHSDSEQTPVIGDDRTTNGPATDHDRTTSRARVPIEKREKSDGKEDRAASPVPDSPRGEASPPKSVNVIPPPLPEVEDGPIVVNGIELPRDLPALLSGIQPGFMHFIRMLLPAGVENTERLLRLTREEWRFMGHGLNPAKVNAIEAHLAETWGVPLGALAKAERAMSKAKGAPVPRQAQGADPMALVNYLRERKPTVPAAPAAKES